MKKISVLVLSYNSEETIIETLESVKQQTYKEIELLIADDASEDKSVDICRKWVAENKERFFNVEIISHLKNKGIPGNINSVLELISGEYFKILAADDQLLPTSIECYVNFVKKTPKILPIGKVELFSDELVDYATVENYCKRCYEFLLLPPDEQYRRLLIQNQIVSPAGDFFPTKFIQNIGGYSEKFRLMEDYPMSIKVMRNGYSYGFIDKEIIRYRISKNSVTGGQMSGLKKTEMIFFFKRRMWYMIQNHMTVEMVKQMFGWIKILVRR